MKAFGVILEANPLHLGHKYLIDEIKKQYQPDYLIAITSTSFSMRGDVSSLDKFTKTSLLLENGFDLVIELPFSMAVQSANYFANNAVSILNNFGITDIVFGSETNSLDLYHKLYNYLEKEQKNPHIKSLSQKQLLNIELNDANFSKDEIEIINKPNFTLGYQYIRSIKNNKYPISYHIIERIGNNYHDVVPTSSIASATTIRNLYQNKINVDSYIPYESSNLIDLNMAYNNLMPIIKYVYANNLVTTSTYFGQKEGINQYILNNGDFNSTFDNLINSLKNKKYSLSLIKRVILHTLLNTINDLKDFNYIRLLGTNKNGLKYINSLSPNIKDKIFSNPKEIESSNNLIVQLLNIELLSTKLFSNITNNNNLYLNEFKLPIRKED